jgi:protein TonB
MFDQTFIEGHHVTKTPATVAFSLVIQVSILCVLTLIPLLYTQGLPAAMLKNLLIAPAPPRAAVPKTPAVTTAPKPISRALQIDRIYAPVAIPAKITVMDQTASAPDIGIAGTAWNTNTANSMGLPGGVSDLARGSPPPPDITQPNKKPPSGPARLGGSVAEANLIHRVIPVYPPLAKSARIQGTVEFTALISKGGSIEHLRLVHGHPLLVRAAREAVEQWKYQPTLLNGVPVEVITDIIVNFTLNQ